MSHFKQRKEKNCLNCNAEVQGRYCHECGQENLEPTETAWHLVTHFFNDITHFDGKFFQTLKYLVARPGFVSKEYMLGRRMSYLNPIRMYIFTSAIFFLIFFSLNDFDANNMETKFKGKALSQINSMDSASFAEFTSDLNGGDPLTRDEFQKYMDTVRRNGFKITPNKYRDKAEYDSALKAGKDHNWFERTLTYKQIELNEKYKGDNSKIQASFINAIMHSFPQMLFVSLPLFALMLQLLYLRRKNFYYANHAIFSVHLYIFIFIVLLAIIGLAQLRNYTGWSWLNWFVGIAYLYIFYYEYKAMRNFYKQRRGKTFLKYILLNTMLLFLVTLLFVVFSFFSLLKI